MKQIIYICLYLAFLPSISIAQKDSLKLTNQNKKSSRPVHWSYNEGAGPKNWGKLSPVYSLCTEGKNQSPVNITNSESKMGIKWNFNYKTSSVKITQNEHVDDIIDNGHTIQITVEEGSTFRLKGTMYHLKQFHFHTPSEHTIDGNYFPMEIHFVHQSDSGQLAVVSILAEEGNPNENLQKIINNLPQKKGDSTNLQNIDLALQFHLPKKNEAYHYHGSLTTPPCIEGVEWLVFRTPIQVGKEQIKIITKKIGPNNRPIQNLNGRIIEKDLLNGKTNNR